MAKSKFKRPSKDYARDMESKDYLKHVNEILPFLEADAQRDKRYRVS